MNNLFAQRLSPDKLQRGFTLLEILIALSIFSIMAVVSTAALYNIFHTQESINRESYRLSQLQFASVRLQRDISQIVNRPIELDNTKMEFTTIGQTNPLAVNKESSLVRIEYLFDEHKLIRYTMPNAQLLDLDKANKEILLNDIKSISYHYLDNHYELQDIWYPRFLPLAIRIDIDSDYFGKISRFFVLPQSIKLSIKQPEIKKGARHA